MQQLLILTKQKLFDKITRLKVNIRRVVRVVEGVALEIACLSGSFVLVKSLIFQGFSQVRISQFNIVLACFSCVLSKAEKTHKIYGSVSKWS